MFLSLAAPQVIAVTTPGANVPVWLLTVIFSVLLMLLFFWLGRKKPEKHQLMNWIGLAFAAIAMIAAAQTNIITALVVFLQSVLASIADGFALTVLSGLVLLVPVIALGVCLVMYHRTFAGPGEPNEQATLHFWMGLVSCLLVVVISQANDSVRRIIADALDIAVGIPMRAIMSFIGGPAPATEGGTAAGQVFVPGTVLIIIFGLMFMMFCLWLGRKKPKRRKLFNWLALAFSTATLVGASQIPAIASLISGIANLIASLANGLSRTDIQTTTAGAAGLIFIILLFMYGASLTKRQVKHQFILMPLIGIMVIILSQSNQTVSDVTMWLVNFGVGFPKDIFLGAAETI